MPLSDVLIAEYPQITSPDRKDVEEIVYPDSDGEPMGETEFHVIATLHLYDSLRHFFRKNPDIYVAADMFLYYEEGNPYANKAPDVMVIKGVEKRKRRTFKIWEEQAVPCVIFEITSKSTIVEDMIPKSFLYASLGVREYFLFDPLKESLNDALVGFRLQNGEYTPIQPDSDGFLRSEELGILLTVQNELVRIIDPQTRQQVPALTEAVERAEQEAQRAEQEAQRAEQERRRAEAAEAELARLRAMMDNK